MTTIVLVKSEKVHDALINSIKKFGKTPGIVVLFTKSHAAIKPLFKRHGIDDKKLLIIDTVAESDEDNVIHTPITNLTALSITIHQGLQALPHGKKFLVVDSLSVLNVNNDPNAVRRFALYLIEHVREWDAEARIIVAKDAAEKGLLAILKQSADKIEEK